jgi:hypothetical protein
LVRLDELFGKFYKYIWLTAILGSILILVESFLNFNNILDAGFSIGISIIIIVCMGLSRKDVYGTGAAMLICSYILLLSPIGFNGFGLGILFILVGAITSASGGIFTYTCYFFYVAIGAIIVDLLLFFI